VTVRAVRTAADGQSSSAVEPESRRLEALHLGDLMQGAPGALTLDFGGALATSTLSIRGASASQVLVALDGLPLGSPAGGAVDLATIPASLLGDARLARGSDGRAGGGAMGGVLRLSPGAGSRALITGGSLGTMGLSASHELQLSSGLRLLASVDGRSTAGDFAYQRDPTPEVEGNDRPVTLLRANNDTQLGSGLVRLEQAGALGRLRLLAFGTWAERGLPGPIYAPTLRARQEEQTLASQLVWDGGGLEVPLQLRAGRLLTRDGDALTMTGEQHFTDVALRPVWSVELSSWQLAVSGLAGQERFDGSQHGRRERLRAGGGVELLRPRGAVTGSVSLRAESWGEATGLMPRLGGSVRLLPGLAAYGNVGGGFRAPSFGELYYASGPVLANPALRPERSWSGDLGLRWERGGGGGSVLAAATLFGGRYEDVIVYELFSGSRAKPFNIGLAQVGGAELELKARAKEGPLAGLGGGLTATWMMSNNLAQGANLTGNDLPYRPRERGSAWLEHRGEQLRARVGLDYTGGAFSNQANTRTVAPFWDLRASAGMRLGGPLWLSAEVRNALDQQDRASVEGYPLPGRVLMAHLAWMPEEPVAAAEEPLLDVRHDPTPASIPASIPVSPPSPELAATPSLSMDGGGGP